MSEVIQKIQFAMKDPVQDKEYPKYIGHFLLEFLIRR